MKTVFITGASTGIANAITGLRIPISVALLFCPVFSPLFYALYLIAGFSDMADGIIARKTDSVSEFGSRFDSIADFFFVAICLIKILPVLDIPIWLYVWTAVIALIRIINIISGYAMQKRFVAVHTTMNKVTGVLLFMLPLTLTIVPPNFSAIPICSVATFAAIQEGHFIRAEKMKKYLPLDCIAIESQNISYSIFGEGDIDLVIEMGLGAVAGEWWHIAEQLSKQFTVLLYERGRNISKSRSPKNIADELHTLLMKLPCKDKITFLAHSQGGLYAQQFARMYPDMVRGIAFADPLSANDNTYKSVFLTAKEQKKSGFDKSENFLILRKMAFCHLGSVIKLLMRKAPPFYYYDQFSPEAKKYILDELTKVSLHDAALEEYRLAHEEKEISQLKEKGNFPQIPIVLITHGSEFEIKEIMEFGQTSKEFAVQVEELWQSLMQEYLTFSEQSTLIRANNSGHYIHLTDFDVIKQALQYI